MRRKILVSLLMVLILASMFLLNGCGSSKQDKDKIVMWIMPNSQEPASDVEKILRPFLAKHPGVEIEVVPLDWGSAWQKITAAAAANVAPDVCQLGSTWVGAIAGMGALEDVSDKVAELGGSKSFVPSAWSTSGLENSDAIVAIPWIVDVRAMYYRTDVFEKLGLTVKDLKTWHSFEQALIKIKNAGLIINGKKVEPLAITGKNDWNIVHNIAPWVWAAGGSFFNKEYSSSIINGADSFDGMYFYINLVRKGLVPNVVLEQNTSQINNGFFNGRYAIYFNGPYDLKTLQTPPERGGASNLPVAKNFAVAPYPAGRAGVYTFTGGSNLAIFKASKHKEMAWEIIKYLSTNRQAQVAYSKLTGFLPSYMEAFKDPYFSQDPYRKVFRDSVAYGRAYPCIPAWGPIETVVLPRRFGIMWNEVVKDSVGFNKEKLQKQLDLAAKEINAVPSLERERNTSK